MNNKIIFNQDGSNKISLFVIIKMDKTYLMLLNNNCTSNKCEINDDIKKYCMENDNLLTEDMCHNLYTRNVYDNSNEELSLLLKEKCKKYPMHTRCMCSNYQRKYDYNNLLGGYGLNCLFPECSKNTINYDPSNSNSSLLPLDIYLLDNSCPKNICQNIIKNSNFELYSSDISIANNCNNENNENTTTTTTTITPITQTTTPITQTTSDTINIFNLWILIVICCILFIIILILVIIFIGRSYNNNNNQEEV